MLNCCSFEYDMRQFLKSFVQACNGFPLMFKEKNFTIHIGAAFTAIFLCIFLQVSTIEFLIVVVCIATVISAEIFNSAVEKLCDFVHPEEHEQIKVIKDIAAAAVLMVALASFIVGVVIFVPKLVDLFF